ncbi:hypothetical protein K7X08_004145 [Anisodus acutangulus]|uniref:At1g61320/AtMIF1 LRR domain-containing protein n=1 Tax=Anisodus acutangulus TaxID=402998 RepID=A0A9Q1MM16_9SOLA|nr:hypothetical protein K7X08_004145 [Anisodus acutangulus]
MIDIVAPNLEDLYIGSFSRDLDVINNAASKSIKHLKLSAVAVNDQWLESIFSNLPNLEICHFVSCLSLRIMKISSYRLKLLEIVTCCNLIAVDLDTPNVIVIPKDMRENLLPPLYGAKRLHIKIMDQTNYSVVDVVDSLLWISPQVDTLSVDQGRSLNSLIKFTYRDAANEDEKPCCASQAWKCWRHELKKVKLQNFARTELEKLRNYFLTNTDTLSIIENPSECSL